jgi:hypothetical protein
LFSEVCCWIFNHSNIIQVDITSNKDTERSGALVIENITATWPSTRIDRIQLDPPRGESLKFELVVNGYAKGGEKFSQRAVQSPDNTDYRDQTPQSANDPEREYSGATNNKAWREKDVLTPRSTIALPGGVDNTPVGPQEPARRGRRSNAVTQQPQSRQPKQSRQTQPRQPDAAVTVSSSTVDKINKFFQNHDVSRTVNNIVGFCTDILTNPSKRVPQMDRFMTDFKALIKDPQIERLLRADVTHDAINLEILDEVRGPRRPINVENQIDLLATVFWTLVALKYKTLPNSATQFNQAVQNIVTVVEKLNATGADYIGKFLRVKYSVSSN